MNSDALIAVNRFVQPLPLASLWILSLYYLAQTLIERAHIVCPYSNATRGNIVVDLTLG